MRIRMKHHNDDNSDMWEAKWSLLRLLGKTLWKLIYVQLPLSVRHALITAAC